MFSCLLLTQESDGEKSDDNLVVDVSNEVRNRASRAKGPTFRAFYSRLVCAPTAGPDVPQRKPRPLSPGERLGQAPRGEEGRPSESVVRGLVQQHAFHQVQRDQCGESPDPLTCSGRSPPGRFSASLCFQNEKSTTPVSKSSTPTSHTDAPTPSTTSALRSTASKPPGVETLGESLKTPFHLQFWTVPDVTVAILSSRTAFCVAAAGLRTPLAVPCSYPNPFGMVAHPGINGELSGAGAAYSGLHNISPQMSAVAAAAVAAYGRTQVVHQQQHTHTHTQSARKMVTFCPIHFKMRHFPCWCRWDLILTTTFVSLASPPACQASLEENRRCPAPFL